MATYHQTTKTTTATTTTSTFGQHHQHILLVIFLIILSSFVQCLLTTNDINNLIISDKSNFDFSKTIIAYHNGRLNRSSSDRPFLLHTQFRPYIINVTLSAVTFDTELLSHHIDLSFVNRSKIYLGGIGQLHQVGVYGDGQTNDGRTLRIDISRPFISNITLDEDDDCFPRIPTSHREGAFSRWHKEKLIKTIFQVKDVLFTCGIDNCGLCTIIKLGANGFERTREFNDTSEPVSFLASRRSSYVFKGHYHNAETFYVGFEPDDRAINSTPPFLSARTFSHSYFTYTLDMNNFRSKVEFSRKENLKQSYPIQFLYGFEYGRFAYMVTIQPAKLYSSLMETRLIRICTEDDSFRSYSEIPLVCRSPAMNDHQIAVAATITHQINDDDDDDDVDDNDKKKKKSTLLYVTFENGQWSNRMNGTLNSAICSYTMEDIETAFRNSIVNCYHLGDRAGLVSSIYGEERNCVAIEGNLDPYELECAGTGTISHNRYILGKVPIAGRYEFTIFNDLVTSIGAVRLNLIEQRATRLVVATNNSRLITLDLSDDDDTIDVKQYYELNRTAIGPFRSNPLFESSNGGYLYFRSQNGLIQIGIQSCATYTTCTACFMFGSHCWWWNDRCIRSKHVPEEHRLAGPICSPIVYNFTPQIGPIQGGTIIMIYGDNFGGSSLPSQTLDDYVNVTIGRRQCIVQKRTKKMIECQLDKQIDEMDNMIDSGMMVSVHVSYHKDAALLHYNINGTDTSKQHFTFVTASVKGIHPWYGPRIGGTTVALFGENFHIGTNVKVEFISNRGRFPCRMRNRSRRFVICVTSNNTYNDDDDNEDIDLQINLSIDYFTYELNNNQSFNVDSSYIFNTEYDEKRRRRMISSRINPYSRIGSSLFVNMLLRQSKLEFMESFEYRPNPRIISVHDFRSNGSIVYDSFHTIETGGTELIFEGMNLDSIWYPLIDVIFFDSNGWNHSIVSNCTVIQSTMIVCLLPKLSGRAINSYKPVNARFILHMDGFKWNGVPSEPPALIIYHRKPEFRSFDSLVHVEIDEPTIQLEGNYLFDELPYNITVNDTIQCIRDRLASSEKSILCRFELTDEVHSILEYDVPYRIRVQIGYNVQFEFGEMAFSNNQAISSFGFISIMFVLVLLIILVVVFIIRNQLQRAKINARDKGPYALVDMPTKTLEDFFQEAYDDCKLYDELCRIKKIIDKCRVVKHDIGSVGQGHFGVVYRGRYLHADDHSLDVAIKTFRRQDDTNWLRQLKGFLSEAETMKDFDHPNVIKLFGVTLVDDLPAILMPYMSSGDLRSYLLNENNQPNVRQLLDFAVQIATGMCYLSELNFVHRDLAARNCLIGYIDRQLIVKVSDFGLTRFMDKQYYEQNNQRELPYRWMPLDLLEGGTHVTTKSDVWSFGVVMWEIITRGQIPYGSLDMVHVAELLRSGKRLQQSNYCPNLIYGIMLDCWYVHEQQRPTFIELRQMIINAIRLIELDNNRHVIMMLMPIDNGSNQNYSPCPFNYNSPNIQQQVKQYQTSMYEKASSFFSDRRSNNDDHHNHHPSTSMNPNGDVVDGGDNIIEDNDDVDDDDDVEDEESEPYAPPPYSVATGLFPLETTIDIIQSDNGNGVKHVALTNNGVPAPSPPSPPPPT